MLHIINPEHDKPLLQTFINKKQPDSFRYFKTRKTADQVLQNHLLTLMVCTENDPIAYAHVDFENETYWLGFCVLEPYQRKGFGKLLIEAILNRFGLGYTLSLTVDVTNVPAIRLYSRYNFEVQRIIEDRTFFMQRTADQGVPPQVKVSIGECLDKLSILDIKLKKIQNSEKLHHVRCEREALFENRQVQHAYKQVPFYYQQLMIINEMIWDDQDTFRECRDEAQRAQLCAKIIEDNDARFRVKNKINSMAQSTLKEQKGYNPRVAAIMTHLGLGDHLTAIGMVRYYGTRYDKVIVACKPKNLQNVQSFYADDTSITVMAEEDPTNFAKKCRQLHPNVTLLKCGIYVNRKNFNNVPFCFYDDLKLPHHLFWSNFYLPISDKAKKIASTLKGRSFAFVHNTCSQGKVFHLSDAQHLFSDDMLIIDPCTNHYKPSDKNYKIAQSFLGHHIVDYTEVIRCAQVLVLNPSSFFCLAIHFSTTPQSYYVSNKDYSALWNDVKTTQPFRKAAIKNLIAQR